MFYTLTRMALLVDTESGSLGKILSPAFSSKKSIQNGRKTGFCLGFVLLSLITFLTYIMVGCPKLRSVRGSSQNIFAFCYFPLFGK